MHLLCSRCAAVRRAVQASAGLPRGAGLASSPLPLLVASFLLDAAHTNEIVQTATPPDDASAAPDPSAPADRSVESTPSATAAATNLPQPSEQTPSTDAAQQATQGIAPNVPTEATADAEPTPAASTNDAPLTPPAVSADAVDSPPTPPTEAPATTPASPTPAVDSNPAESSTENSNWSLHFLRQCTLITSMCLICIGSTVWLAGIKLFRYSPPLLCALILTLWTLVCCNAVVAAWSSEAGSQPGLPDGAPVLPGDRDVESWGLDLGTASGAATFAALLGTIGGIAFLAWIMTCSKGGAQHAPKTVAVVWGMLLGAIVHTGGIAWLLDTSTPETLAWNMHGSLLLSCLFCCALTLLHMQRDDRGALIAATAGCGSWSLVRGLVMILLFLETATESHTHAGKEMNREWKWPNEWNLPLRDEAHPSRVSSFDGRASDPSYASSVPYSSLAGSVTQDDIVMNVNLAYYFYLALIGALFVVGASIQSIRPRSSRQLLAQFLDSQQSSRRSSSHALLGSGSGGSGRKYSGGSSGHLPSATTMHRGSSYSEGSYGALGSTTPNSNGSNGHRHGIERSKSHEPATPFYHRRPASDDLNVGSSSSWGREPQGQGSSGGDLEQGLRPNSGSSRSVSSSPLKPAKSASRTTKSGPGSSSQDWSRRTSFSLAIDVTRGPECKGQGQQFSNGPHVSRSPSAPVLSVLDDDHSHVALPGAIAAAGAAETTHYILSPIVASDSPPASEFAPKQLVVVRGTRAPSLGGVSGSLRRMQQVASALKADKHRHRHAQNSKKSISFMTEFGVVQPQRTPEPPPPPPPLPQPTETASADLVRHMGDSTSPLLLHPSPRDSSAPAALLTMHPSGSVNASPAGSESGASQATPLTPAWSPYPLMTREDLEAQADQIQAAAAAAADNAQFPSTQRQMS